MARTYTYDGAGSLLIAPDEFITDGEATIRLGDRHRPVDLDQRPGQGTTSASAPALRRSRREPSHSFDLSQDLTDRSVPLQSLDLAGSQTPSITEELAQTRPIGQWAAWSKRYVADLIACDAIFAVLAVLLASMLPKAAAFDELSEPLTLLAGGLCWPLAVAFARGYERAKIGVGGDEMRAVLRAGVFLIAAGSVASVMFVTHGLSALVVLSSPIAAAGSIATRFAARKHLHHQQRQGRNVRKVIIVGSSYAAADLALVLDREGHFGMQVLGVAVPQADAARAQERGLKVLGDIDDVPRLVLEHGADAVAVTGGDATRHNYLRELSWALEGSAVELLVHPGPGCTSGPTWDCRCCTSSNRTSPAGAASSNGPRISPSRASAWWSPPRCCWSSPLRSSSTTVARCSSGRPGWVWTAPASPCTSSAACTPTRRHG